MKFPNLTSEEILVAKNLCLLFPTYLRNYLGMAKDEEFPTLKELQVRTSKEFLRNRHVGRTIEDFYKECDTFLPELTLYTTNPGRIQSVCKRLRVLRRLGVEEVVDYGSGVGADAFVYAHFGIRSIQVEYKNDSRKFSRWLFNYTGMSKSTRYVTPDKFLRGLKNTFRRYDAIQAIELVAHVENPYYLFEKLMDECGVFLWTNDIGLHRDGIEDVQHLPHNLKEVIASLDKRGKKLEIEDMAIPPRVWVRK